MEVKEWIINNTHMRFVFESLAVSEYNPVAQVYAVASGRSRLHLLSQIGYVNGDHLRVAVLITPHLFQQLLATVDPAWVTSEVSK